MLDSSYKYHNFQTLAREKKKKILLFHNIIRLLVFTKGASISLMIRTVNICFERAQQSTSPAKKLIRE